MRVLTFSLLLAIWLSSLGKVQLQAEFWIFLIGRNSLRNLLKILLQNSSRLSTDGYRNRVARAISLTGYFLSMQHRQEDASRPILDLLGDKISVCYLLLASHKIV